jgi:hypothetical protein
MIMTEKEYDEKVPENFCEIDGELRFPSPLSCMLHRHYFFAHIDDYLRGKYRQLADFDPLFARHFWALSMENDDRRHLYLTGCWWYLRPGDKLIDEDGKIIEVYAIGPITQNSIDFCIEVRRPYDGSAYIFSLYEQDAKKQY